MRQLQKLKSHSGFALIEFLLFLVFLGALIGVGYYVYAQKTKGDANPSQSTTQVTKENESSEIIWSYTQDNEWASSETPPKCEEPIELTFPSDVSTATNTLWPGQVRGDFKAHGGVRYDNTPSGEVEVVAPYDARVYRVGRYDFDGSGEQQMVIDFINNCGIMYRFDHLLELAPKFRSIYNNFPGDGSTSQFYEVDEQVAIEKGELLATKIGFPAMGNVFYDLGVYDLRQKNEASQNKGWASQHAPEVAHYGVCWFDLMPDDINQTLRNLPTGKEGKTSAYC